MSARRTLVFLFLCWMTAASCSAGGRYFLALDLPERLHPGMGEVQQSLRPLEQGGEVEWSPLPGLHITLVFLGAQSDERLQTMLPELEQVARRHRPFQLAYRGLRTFPHFREPRPRVIWARPGGDRTALRSLAIALRRVTRSHGVPSGGYPFRPHVTLARLHRLARGRDVDALLGPWQEADLGRHRVRDFVLFRSRPEGPHGVYQEVRRFPLEGASRRR